jgi:photosystem II stability/assembly factor-like uncharacterized protein
VLTLPPANSKMPEVSNTRKKRIAHLNTAVTFILVLFLLGVSAVFMGQNAAAAAAKLEWKEINIPADGAAGGWVLANGSDIRHLTAAGDGALYAYGKGLLFTLYKSTDGGIHWSQTGQVQDEIVDIAVSPHDPATVYYATSSLVYRSTDAGKTFLQMPPSPGGAGSGNITITSISATWLNGNIIAVGTADADNAEFGGVYTLDETQFYVEWENNGIGPYDVYAVAFSPDYALDRYIVAVATDETNTFVINEIGNSGWNTYIGMATLKRDNSGVPAPVAITQPVAIAFRGDFNALDMTADRNIYVGIDTGIGEGDVYKVGFTDTPGASTATDLNIGGVYGEPDIDIAGLSVFSATGGNVLLVAGAAGSSCTYTSTDGGTSWIRSLKEPTGSYGTEVLFAPDYSVTGRIFAATVGAGSALSISHDLGVTWNQLSFIDTTIADIVDMAPSPVYSQDNTLFMITANVTSDLWRSMDSGNTWERILSSAYAGIDSLNMVGLPPEYGADCRTVFVYGSRGGKPAIWKSGDNGQSYFYQVTSDPATGAPFTVNCWAIVDKDSLYIGSFDGVQGAVYRTDNGGYFYSGKTPVGGSYVYSIALSPDFANDGAILTGNASGWIYLSTDSGASFQTLPPYAAAPSLTGKVTAAFDPDFKLNHTVYAASDAIDGGVYRFIVGESAGWTRVDASLPAGAKISRLVFTGNGVLYASNMDVDGGVVRCLNPQATPAVFEAMTDGLDAGVVTADLWQCGGRLWTIDAANRQLLTYFDTLSSPVIQVSPENAAGSVGSLTGHVVKNVTIDWETLDGATGYEWQCSDDSTFSSIPAGFTGTTSYSTASLPELEPATTYYWRVRASSPVHSPWSLKWRFTTSLDTEIVTLTPKTPAVGVKDVPVKPVFEWTAVVGAGAYELLVATDADFSHPVIVKINEYSLPVNAWQSDVSLDYETTYYWKVRATASGTKSAWSAVGVFTTESAPPLNEESPPITPPGETTPATPQDTITSLSSPGNVKPYSTSPPAEQAVTISYVPAPTSGQLADLPAWLIYFVGALLGIVILILAILLVVILKIKRIS